MNINLHQLSRDKGLDLDEAIQYCSISSISITPQEYDRLKEAKDLLEKVYGHAEFEDKELEQKIERFIKQEINP